MLNQLDMFTLTHSRATDPKTSVIAAKRAVEFVPNHCERILDCLRRFGPQTIDDLAMHTGLTAVQVARRTADLHKDHKAMPNGQTRLSVSGRPERVWEAAQ